MNKEEIYDRIKSGMSTQFFFKSGFFTFLIIGVCNFVNLFVTMSMKTLWGNISTFAGSCFSLITAWFFWFLWQTQKPTLPDSSDQDVIEAMKEIEDKK